VNSLQMAYQTPGEQARGLAARIHPACVVSLRVTDLPGHRANAVTAKVRAVP